MKKNLFITGMFLLWLCAAAMASPFAGKSKPEIPVCDICVNNICNQPFALGPGQTYTFYTTAVAGANYSWSVTGTGLTIVGPRNGATVQVSVGCNANGQICLTKSVNGMEPCCICFPVISGPCPPVCCQPDFLAYYHCETSGPKPGGRGGFEYLLSGCPENIFSHLTIELGDDATFLNPPYTGMSYITVYNPTDNFLPQTYWFQYNSCINYPWPPHLLVRVTYYYTNPACPPFEREFYVEPESTVGNRKAGQTDRPKAKSGQLALYPNPARTTLNFTNPENLAFNGTIFNSQGTLLMQFNGRQQPVNIAALKPGLYFVKLTGTDGRQLLLTQFKKE